MVCSAPRYTTCSVRVNPYEQWRTALGHDGPTQPYARALLTLAVVGEGTIRCPNCEALWEDGTRLVRYNVLRYRNMPKWQYPAFSCNCDSFSLSSHYPYTVTPT